MVSFRILAFSSVVVLVASASDCLTRINHHRATWGVAPVKERTDLHSCVNKQAAYDHQHGAHKAFRWCGEYAQGEGGGHSCTDVIDAFYNERWSCSAGSGPGSPISTTSAGSKSGCMKACNDNGKCKSFDFDGGSSCRLFKDPTSSDFMASVNASRTYCKAGACTGHCGGVMDEKNEWMSWGQDGTYFTVNYKCNPTLPAEGSKCPSQVEALRCYQSSYHEILWVHGLGGPTCKDTCGMAGAKWADFSCDGGAQIHGFDHTATIMKNFGGYKCQHGQCWSGASPTEFNGIVVDDDKRCYFPHSESAYTCDEKLGNANCYGKRFSQLCACKPTKFLDNNTIV